MLPHLSPAALAKAKALAIVAAALTAGGAGGMVALNQVSGIAPATPLTISGDSTSPTPTPTATATAAATVTGSATTAVDTQATPTSTAYALPSCPSDGNDHGGYVSSVARGAPHAGHGDHGKWVSQAARSDCGKTGTHADATESTHPKHSEAPETETPRPTKLRRSSDTSTGDSQTGDSQTSGSQSSDSQLGSSSVGTPTSTSTHGGHHESQPGDH